MNVLIFGASGGIGKWAVEYALQDGHHLTAYVRHPEKVQITSDHLTLIQGQITDKEKITKALSGQNAVSWCVGIPMKRKYPVMQSLEGHKILIQAMKEQGIKRFIDWGTPSIRFEQDKKSLITVAPGILAGIAFPQAKKRNGSNRAAASNIGARVDPGSIYGSERYPVYRQSKNRIWRCKNEIQHFSKRYWRIYG